MDSEIIIVSGLPRSGTSLMMQMLRQGGIDIVTDEVRRADTDNPKGYCEFEQVKAIERDSSWIPATRGRAFKMVSQLLYHLPMVETYRITRSGRSAQLAGENARTSGPGPAASCQDWACLPFSSETPS
jgi:hypothetical protein